MHTTIFVVFCVYRLCISACEKHILVSETWIRTYPGFGTELRDSGWDVERVKKMCDKQR